MPRTRIQPIYLYAGSVNKFGKNLDTDANSSTETDIVRQDGLQYWPGAAVAAASIDLWSSSAEDDVSKPPAGTGAHSTWLDGLDGDGAQNLEEVANDGAADTQPVGDKWRIFRAFVGDVGTGGTNAGNLTIDDGTNVLAYIAAGESQTQAAAYTVPAGDRLGRAYKEARLHQMTVSLAGTVSATMDFALWIRENASVGVSTTAWKQIQFMSIGNGVTHDRTFPIPLAIPILTDMRISAVDASVANLVASATFTLELVY